MVAIIGQQVYCVCLNKDQEPDSSVVSSLLPHSLNFSDHTEGPFTD